MRFFFNGFYTFLLVRKFITANVGLKRGMNSRSVLLAILTIAASVILHAQATEDVSFIIQWNEPELRTDGSNLPVLSGKGLSLDEHFSPSYYIYTSKNQIASAAQLVDAVYILLPEHWADAIYSGWQISSEPMISVFTGEVSRKPISGASIVPVRKNALGQLELLVSGKIRFTLQSPDISSGFAANKSTSNSVLSVGNWFKLGVAADGVYRVNYENLLSSGAISAPVPSSSVKLFGNGGRMLPEPNAQWRADDLIENPIQVEDGGDGTFGPGDYFLFYGKAPHRWFFDPADRRYKYIHHLYSDTTFYFFTAQGTGGKRIQARSEETGSAVYTTGTSDEFFVINDEKFNLNRSGRLWMGDYFNFTSIYNYPVNLSGWNGSPVKLRIQAAARCVSCGTTMLARVSGTTISSFNINAASPSYTAPYAVFGSGNGEWTPASSSFTLDVVRQSGQEAWLDFVEFNYRKSISVSNAMIHFRDSLSIGRSIVQYNISNVSNVIVWDVSRETEPVRQLGTSSGTNFTFKVAGDTLRTFVAFNSSLSGVLTPAFIGSVPNQNLHALTREQPAPDLIIVTHKDFLPAALELADLHTLNDGMKVHTVTVDQIYNEYSSGAQDITAIRDFVKMYFDHHAPGEVPKYLLLFGDGSYDYKTYLNRTPNNTNFVPSFQTIESFDRGGNSYTSDDFFALLGPTEGISGRINLGPTQTIDIGVGRLVVRTLQEAQDVVKKIIHYESNAACLRDWRNVLTLVADDMEASWESSFFSNSQSIAGQMQNNFPVWNVDKVYLDAFQQVTNAGQRYPDAEVYFTERMNKGTLLVNYIGHGGESGLTSERLLRISDVLSWNNMNLLPAFTTATCTFTRFDDPGFTSAGEIVLLRPDGGGIALFSTVRPISIVPGFNQKFFNATFSRLSDGSMPTLGDIIRLAKQPGNDFGEQNILLFGDPAMKLAYPKFQVFTDEINGLAVDTSPSAQPTDTLKASQTVTIKGHVADLDGNTMTDFNGVLYTTIFDKPAQYITLANDPQAQSFNFELQNNVIFRGKASVTNGSFEFTFKVPLDINYLLGKGKISYYAENGLTDAHGYYNNFMVGGSEDNCQDDGIGPEIRIFMNDTLFRDGGITHSSPVLLVHVSDSSGINTVGSGIGRDIVAYLDGNTTQEIKLNNYFEANLDDFTSGVVRYPLGNISTGLHFIVVQVWDGCNNFTRDTLYFTVSNQQAALIRVEAYPNPFTESVTISFEHNQAGKNTAFDIQISDMNGRLVKRWLLNEIPDGFRQVQVTWDGTGNNGPKQQSGVYICRIRMTTEDGEIKTGTAKLILIN